MLVFPLCCALHVYISVLIYVYSTPKHRKPIYRAQGWGAAVSNESKQALVPCQGRKARRLCFCLSQSHGTGSRSTVHSVAANQCWLHVGAPAKSFKAWGCAIPRSLEPDLAMKPSNLRRKGNNWVPSIVEGALRGMDGSGMAHTHTSWLVRPPLNAHGAPELFDAPYASPSKLLVNHGHASACKTSAKMVPTSTARLLEVAKYKH